MKRRYVYIPLLVGALIPTVVPLVLKLFGTQRPMFTTIFDVGLIWVTALALVPFVALIVAMMAISVRPGWRLECVFWGGLLPISFVTLDMHLAVWWPFYFGGHISSTGVINFIWGPFVALGFLVVGMIVGYLLSWVKDLVDLVRSKVQ